MSNWNVVATCSMELSEFARRQHVTVDVDEAAAITVLDTLSSSLESGGDVVLEACLVKDGNAGLCEVGRADEKRGYSEAIPDYHVTVAVARESRIQNMPPVARDQEAIDRTVAHEFQHVVDNVEQPDMAKRRVDEQLEIMNDSADRSLHGIKASMPTIAEKTMAFMDAFHASPNAAYKAALVTFVVLKLIQPALQERAEMNEYYWQKDPLEIRARAAADRIDEIIPKGQPSPVCVMPLAR